jgi:hypothetical protein
MMSTAARVDSTDAIKEFRIYLAKFQEKASVALGDADSDVNRMTRWLEGEAMNHWTSTIRKRQEELVKAEEAFRFKRLYKDASGSMPSAVEEQKAVQVAKQRLAEAQGKLTNVKRWSRELQKQAAFYRGGVSRFAIQVAQGVPAAIAQLGSTLDHLDQYLDLAAATSEGAAEAGAGPGVAREAAAASMARAAEEAPAAAEAQGVDPAAVRAGAPSPQAALAARPAEKSPVNLACGAVTEQQAAQIAAIAGAEPPGDQQRIVISPVVTSSAKVYLLRLESTGGGWYLGPVDEPDTGVYNTVTAEDLRAGRPDLAALLNLPAGYLAIVDSRGLSAVFNERNENVLAPPQPAAGAAT